MNPERHQDQIKLALMIGNSRLHWAYFVGENLKLAWDTNHLPASVVKKLANCQTLDDLPVELLSPLFLSPYLLNRLPLYLASVVPEQTFLWQAYPNLHVITLDQIPLHNVYSTLGVDRALALWGAGEIWGLPMLVIDGGTALTFTGADRSYQMIGGAILPGLRLQMQSLAHRSASLPLVELQDYVSLPTRWALNTPQAIQSGVLYTIIAGIRDFIEAWWQEFPGSAVTLTGGDRILLLKYLQALFPQVATRVIADPHLIFWGMRSYWNLN